MKIRYDACVREDDYVVCIHPSRAERFFHLLDPVKGGKMHEKYMESDKIEWIFLHIVIFEGSEKSGYTREEITRAIAKANEGEKS